MFDKKRIDEIRQANQAWASRQSKASGEPVPNPRGADGIPLRPHGLYTPADLADRSSSSICHRDCHPRRATRRYWTQHGATATVYVRYRN